MDLEAMNDEKSCPAVYKTRNNAPKKYVVKRNLRGETNLHVACIKGNFKMVQKLLEEVNTNFFFFFFNLTSNSDLSFFVRDTQSMSVTI